MQLAAVQWVQMAAVQRQQWVQKATLRSCLRQSPRRRAPPRVISVRSPSWSRRLLRRCCSTCEPPATTAVTVVTVLR